MPVSREAVTWGYRFILGREPESEQAISSHALAKDETQLAETLIRSEEFANRRGMRPQEFLDPWSAPPLEIETDCSPEDLARCLGKIQEAWAHLGDVRPHFSVIIDKQFLPNRIAEHIDTFWASGEAEATQVIKALARHGSASPSDMQCVEYGCGVGRVTTALARRFRTINAYDISPGHLLHARQRARDLTLTNVFFHECAADRFPELKPCDLFYSRIVFQHNPPPIIGELIRRSLASLRPGGLALFQVPVYITDYRFRLAEWLSADHPLEMQMHCIPQSKICEIVAEQGCVLLEMREEGSTGARHRMVSNMCVVRRPLRRNV